MQLTKARVRLTDVVRLISPQQRNARGSRNDSKLQLHRHRHALHDNPTPKHQGVLVRYSEHLVGSEGRWHVAGLCEVVGGISLAIYGHGRELETRPRTARHSVICVDFSLDPWPSQVPPATPRGGRDLHRKAPVRIWKLLTRSGYGGLGEIPPFRSSWPWKMDTGTGAASSRRTEEKSQTEGKKWNQSWASSAQPTLQHFGRLTPFVRGLKQRTHRLQL